MQRYTKTAIAMHWLIAMLIVFAFTLGLVMTDIPGLTPTKLKYYSWHKWAGVTVLLLAALRLLWRLFHRPPALPATMPRWQQSAAQGLHDALYILMFVVPITGYCYTLVAGVPVVWFGVLPLPVFLAPDPVLKPVLRDVHESMVWILTGVVALHVAAALKHHFIDRDGVLRRMLP